jgi:hypothetical protein
MSVSALQQLVHRLGRMESEAVSFDGAVTSEKRNLRFIDKFINEVDEFDKTIVKKGPIRMFDQNLDDEQSGKVVLRYGDFVIEISHRSGIYSVLLSDTVVRFLGLRGESILDYSGKACELQFFHGAQVNRSYASYVYTPNRVPPGNEKRDVLTVLNCMLGVLKSAPRTAFTELEQSAEYSEHAIYLGEMHTASKFVGGFEEPPYEQWASDPRVVLERADRNAIRRRMNWRVDDGTANLECPLSNPFLSEHQT